MAFVETRSLIPRYNLIATTAPTVNDDIDSGYVIGSRWIDRTLDKEYVCLDNASGAAVWTETTVTGASALHTSYADATLSGTPKIIQLRDDAGTAYYVKVYPTKT